MSVGTGVILGVGGVGPDFLPPLLAFCSFLFAFRSSRLRRLRPIEPAAQHVLI